jgi:hypothetical protein
VHREKLVEQFSSMMEIENNDLAGRFQTRKLMLKQIEKWLSNVCHTSHTSFSYVDKSSSFMVSLRYLEI